MSLKQEIVRVLVLVVIGIPFFFIGGPILFPLLYLFWKYIKLCLKVDIFVIYVAVRIPLWLFIQVPLWAFGKSARRIENFFEHSLNYIEVKRKRAAVVIGILWLIFFFLISPELSTVSIDAFLGIAYDIGWVTVASLVISFFVLSIIDIVGGGSASRSPFNQPEAPGTDPVTGTKEAAAHGREWAEKGKEAKGVYDDIRSKGVKGAAQESSIWPEDIIMKAKNLRNLFSFFGEAESGAATVEAAGTAEAAAGAGAAAAAPIGAVAVIAIILFAILIFWIQLFIVAGYLLSVAKFFMPVVGGAMFGALGLGEDYASWIGGEVGDRYLAGMNIDIDQYMAPVLQAKQKLVCVLEGPACLRRWQYNNTRTPDSQNVGETYSLQLERFEVGSGEQIDIAYQDGSYSPPISFGLSNSRNGLYGINAYNVSYRIRVIDFQRGNLFGGKMDPYCSTGWKPIEGYSIREPDSSDTSAGGDTQRIRPDTDSTKYYGNDLYPGTSASTGFMRLDKINLENCGLLQPGLGQTKTVLLEVKYDYYSEATLYFEAMARQVMMENPKIQKKWKASVTADTPVKSVLNVNSPVLYDQSDIGTGRDAAEPFDMRAALQTSESDVRYKINHLEVVKSDEVKISDSGNNCQLKTKEGNEEILVPAGDARDILSGNGASQWYSSTNAPPFFGCTMELIDPASINPTGQTLSMDVRANYTVKLNQQLDKFSIINSRCGSGEFNCPLLVTQQFAEERSDPDDWKTRCTGPDATDGCVVVEGEPDEWSKVEENLMTGNNLLDYELEEGEYAVNPFKWDIIANDKTVISQLKDSINYSEEGPAAIGLRRTQYQRLQRAEVGFAIVSVMSGSDGIGGGGIEREIRFISLDKTICARKEGNPVELYRDKTGREEFLADEDTRVVVFRPEEELCVDSDSGGG